MDLKLYNTLTRKKEIFRPIAKESVKMYTCGPTVYWYQHIGNLRSYVFSDILKRALLFNGYKVKHVINVTDVGHLTSDADFGEDKMEEAAKKEGKKTTQVAKYYFNEFVKDMKKLNILMPDKWPRASEHIKEQISLVRKLEKKGFTYKTADGIYFDSSKFKDYGKMAKIRIEGLRGGKRIEVGAKKNKTDFALWKFSTEEGLRQQEWKSPWGTGYPGWHLECSAMSMKYLGEKFDIHTGGEDHVAIHHTNEIAQSEAASGKKPFVKYWIHGAFLLNRGAKIGKSSGGFYTISELEENGFQPEHFRYLLLMTHYRKQLNFSLENLESAKLAYWRLRRKIIETKRQTHKGLDNSKMYEKKFVDAINDDLNTSRALEVLWNVLDDFDFEPKKKMKLLLKFDEVFGFGIRGMKDIRINIPEEIKILIEEREKARIDKNFAKADILRERIKSLGYEIEDSAEGAKVTRKV